jgi:hypothetical protein
MEKYTQNRDGTDPEGRREGITKVINLVPQGYKETYLISRERFDMYSYDCK